MIFKIKIGNKYFAGFKEKNNDGAVVGQSYTLEPNKVITNNEGIELTPLSVGNKVKSIVNQMRYGDIPKENITLEIID